MVRGKWGADMIPLTPAELAEVHRMHAGKPRTQQGRKYASMNPVAGLLFEGERKARDRAKAKMRK